MKRPLSRMLWLVATAPLLMASQCAPAFPGGIRIESFEAPIESPTSSIAIGGVDDNGEWIYWNQTAQQSKGTDYSFAGVTNSLGIDDHPNAADNSVWQIGADFTAATGGVCSSGNTTASIPPGGRAVTVACLLPAD